MKKLFITCSLASLLLAACTSETKKESIDSTETSVSAPAPPVVTSDSSDKVVPPPPIASGDETTYNYVSMEKPPLYPGGMPAFYKFISKNLTYPTAAIKNNVQGSVLLSFTIEKDGSLTATKVERKLGYGTDEEALRVLNLSEKWSPGMVEGKPVRVKYTIPVKFTLGK